MKESTLGQHTLGYSSRAVLQPCATQGTLLFLWWSDNYLRYLGYVSPELLQDPSRDFSLYVLDPLEAHPVPSTVATNEPSPRGVAVALGLMSWALESAESATVHVTGTILPGFTAVEVVFALREVRYRQKVDNDKLC